MKKGERLVERKIERWRERKEGDPRSKFEKEDNRKRNCNARSILQNIIEASKQVS